MEWSEENRSVTVKNEDKTILFDPKAATITDAGHSYFAYEGDLADNDIGAGCIFTGGRIYTASETLASCLGMKTALDQTGNTLALTAAPREMLRWKIEDLLRYRMLTTNIQYPYITAADQAVSDKINAVILADGENAKKEAQDNLKLYSDIQIPHKFETTLLQDRVSNGDLLSVVLSTISTPEEPMAPRNRDPRPRLRTAWNMRWTI